MNVDRIWRKTWSATVALIGSCAAPAAGADGLLCAARDIAARYETAQPALGIALEGELAYVGASWDGLLILDVSDPAAPRLVGSCDTPGPAGRIALMGSYALVPEEGLQVIDVSDPSSPVLVATMPLPPSAKDIAVVGTLALIAAGGLQVVDLSDPFAPTIIGSFDTPGSALGLDVSGGVACIADGTGGVQIVSIADPANPGLLGSFDTASALAIDVIDDLAYVATIEGLVVLDIADPARPELVGSAATEDYARDVTVEGGRAYLDGGRYVFDVSTPARPTLVGSYPHRASAAEVRGVLVFASASGDGVLVIDAASPPPSGILSVLPDVAMEAAEVDGHHVFAADGFRGLVVIDVSDPSTPVEIASLNTGGSEHDVSVNQGFAYVADLGHLVTVVDVADPAHPILGPTIAGTFGVERLGARGDRLCGLTGTKLHIVDVSDPLDPHLLASHPVPPERAHGRVHIDSGLAYVAHGDFRIFDLSRPTEPPIVVLDPGWPAQAVHARGDRAYLAGGEGLAIFDVSDPSAPMWICEIALPRPGAEAIEVVGETAFVALERDGLWVLDVSNPQAPRLLATARGWLPPFASSDVSVQENIAYIADVGTGLHILDISDCLPCPADFNRDGVADSRDVIAFLNAWATERGQDCSTGDCSTDLNGDGIVDSRDVIEFLGLWAAGCE